MAWRSRRRLSHGPLSWPLLPGSELVALCAALSSGPHEYRSDGRTYHSDLRGKGFSTSRAHCLDSGSGLDPLWHARDRRARCTPSERSRHVMGNPWKEFISRLEQKALALPHKNFLRPLQVSLFLRFYPDRSSKTASSLIYSGAGEEHGLRYRERRRCCMRQAGMSSLSPPHTDRLPQISRGGKRGKVVEVSSQAGSAATGRTSVS